MQNMMAETGWGGMDATILYFETITEVYDVADTKRLLRNSPSFQIVKKNPNVALETIERHPEFKELLD